MNLKLVVAAMSLLGLVSSPVFAATQAKHKHHHHKAKPQMVVERDYKEMGMMPVAQPAEACIISQSSMLMDKMTQNLGRSLPNACSPNWFNRVGLSGGIVVDAGKWGNRNANFMGVNYQRLSLNDVYLNLQASINDWTRAFASISYNTATINDPVFATTGTHFAEYDAAYANNITSGSGNTLQIEQAFATFGNFDVSPVFVQVGKQFQDFSRYEIHPITESLTQVMSETLATSAKLGFYVPLGFTGSVSVFDDPIAKVGQSNKPTNYIAALGYDAPNDVFGWDLGAAYIYNLIGANNVAYAVNQFNVAAGVGNGYNSRVSGTALYADINSGPFVVGARYTTALQRFNIADLPKDGLVASTTGARPWAAGIQAGYGFDVWGKDQNVYLGYQTSREAAGLLLPKYRWLAGYGIDVMKNTSVGLEWDHDKAFNVGNGGTGNTYNLVSLRAGVKFS